MWTGLRNALVLTLLAVAAAATWWWSRSAPPGTAQPGGTQRFGYYMEGVVLTTTDAEGRRDIEISAASLAEEVEHDRLVFDDVVVERRLDNGARWQITAERATGPADGSRLEIAGGIEIVLERPGENTVVARTDALSFDRPRGLLRSRGPVAVTIGAREYTAASLEARLNDDNLTLESLTNAK